MGYMKLEDAKKILEKPPEVSDEIVNYTIKKLGFSEKEFEKIYSLPPKTFHDYHTSYPIIKKFSFILKFAVKWKMITPVLYEKYLN